MPYFLYINNEVRGPYGEYELHDMLAHREIQPNVLASEGGNSEWKPLEATLGFTPGRASMKPDGSLRTPYQRAPLEAHRTSSQESKAQSSHKASPSFALQDELTPPFRSPLWQVAAKLVIAYVFLTVLASIYYRWWSGHWDEPMVLINRFMRLVACLFLARDLSQGKAVAYWILICASGILSFFGTIIFIDGMQADLLIKSPYPYIDIGISVLILGLTSALFIVLLILPLHKPRV